MNERLTAGRRAGDEGFTLIEVLVALLVFAIVSTGIIAGLTTIVQMTTDNRSRVTAANLASQELDTVRATSDTYTVQSAAPRDIPVDGRTYTLTRTVTWVSSEGSSVSCNSSTNLFFLHVNVRVTWTGMSAGDKGVQDDTILAPADGSTNSSLGAIAVSVVGFDGLPVSGIAVTVAVDTGGPGETPTAPKATTDDGCTYANGVKPGNYVVSIFKSGYRDQTGNTNPLKKPILVTAGNTTSVQFIYDQAGSIGVQYTFNTSAVSSAQIPANLPVNFTSGGTTFSIFTILAALLPKTYNVTAGTAQSGSKTCAAIDPGAWVAADVNGVSLKAGVTSTVTSLVNVSSTAKVPLGVVLVNVPVGQTITAIQAPAQGAGNPGCDVRSKLTYSVSGTGTWVALALPYGSWTISGNDVPLVASAEQVLTNTALAGVSSDGTVTLDPRRAE